MLLRTKRTADNLINYREDKMKAIIDRSLEKYLSRKLLVWITTTCLLVSGFVNSEQWVTVALAYLGSLGLADIATRWKQARLNKEN